MYEHKKRFRIEFTVDVNNEGIDGKEDWDWSDEDIENFALQELECMWPFPEDVSFSDANPWHTGTPTENGLYLVCLIYCGNTYYLGMHFNDGVWNDSEYEYGFDWLKVDMLAWMPIEPYKEEYYGRE